ncbi:MAG TPA: Asp-tRNA(Asn)/Glu-tRNA(Gln) amidotransferase subunit GatC [Firmicutes bacterium]|nr:Asp-tRNA(Asn)/Glu-tRNA(Gln) amidotransferase subunit GatC [Bacillota bacterium]
MIDRQEIVRIARLARLELGEDEIEQHRRDLNRFLASCAKLQEIDVSELEGSAHAVKAGHKLRKDVPEPSLAQDAVLAGGPGIQDGFFRVPRIVEGGE